MRLTIALLGALLCAAASSAQEPPKVWRDADLLQPLPQLHRTADPAILAAFKARAETLPLGAGGSGSGGWQAPKPPQAPRWAQQEAEPRFYAAQPIYPFVALVSPRWPIARPRPAAPLPKGRR